MHSRLATWPVLILLLTVVGTVDLPAAEPEGRLLFGFDDAKTLETWTVHKGASVASSASWLDGGGRAMRLTIRPGSGNPWPGAWAMAGKALSVTDFSGHDVLSFRVRNLRPRTAVFGIKISDRAGKRISRKFVLDGKQSRLFALPYNRRSSPGAPSLALDKIREVVVYASKPRETLDLAFDEFRLVGATPEPVAGVEPNLRHDDVVLFDFDSPGSLKDWHIERDTTARLQATGGFGDGMSMRVTVKPETGFDWPGVYARAGAALQRTDFSGYTLLCFEARNVGDREAHFKVKVSDTGGRNVKRNVALAPGQSAALQVPLDVPMSSKAPVLALDQIADIVIYMPKPTGPVDVVLDNVRLSTRARERVHDYARRVDALAGRLKTPHLPGKADNGLNALGRKVPQLRKALHAARDGRLPDAETLDRWEHTLLRLEGLPRLARLAETGAGYVLRRADPMTRAHLYASRLGGDLPLADGLSMRLLRNEFESCQLILLPTTDDLENVRWTLEELKDGAGRQLDASVRVVGYVDCPPTRYDAAFAGWWPDPLLPGNPSIGKVPVGEVLALWLTAGAADDTPAGTYTGVLRIEADGHHVRKVPVRAEVLDAAIPRVSSIPLLSQTTHRLDKYMEVVYGGRAHEMNERMRNAALRYRISPTDMYRNPSPRWQPDRLRDLVDRGMNVFVLGQYGNHAVTLENLPQYHARRTPEFATWRDNYRKLRQVGYDGPVVMCLFDEMPTSRLEVVRRGFHKLREQVPEGVDLLMVGTLDPEFGNDWPGQPKPTHWCPIISEFDEHPEALARFRARGGKVWMYTCISRPHPYPMFYIEYGGTEARLMGGAMLWKYKVDGWLYYALCRWHGNDKPLSTLDGRRTDWNPASYPPAHNGSGSLIYGNAEGPVATIRLENLRDGFEDYELYRLADRLSRRRGTDPVRVDPRVVTDTRHWTSDPATVLAERERLLSIVTAK